MSNDILQLSIKLNIVMKLREQYERVQSKLQKEIIELKQTISMNDDEIKTQKIELIRLREEMSTMVIEEEILRSKIIGNQNILDQTINN